MRITAAGGVGPIGQTGSIAARAGQRTKESAAGSFDQLIVRENSFQKQLVGKLSQEVRAAATTTGTVAALRGQVETGEYRIDPHAIARSLLFVWGA